MAAQMYDTLMNDVKAAMKAHDMTAVNALRGVLAKAKDLTVNAGKEMTDDAILQVARVKGQADGKLVSRLVGAALP